MIYDFYGSKEVILIFIWLLNSLIGIIILKKLGCFNDD